ncbi:hypothetical protein C8F04DRAFT_1266797 [Mycena alexandri]|uniref:Uncharacterized protein n=1 Tax=Mycena alexandri TaxID=1745969 RepID=A0AAD6WW78_9AGAR|nr:hypothetical protein C8F04DRAFT_1266797 [Mycena alexandri]
MPCACWCAGKRGRLHTALGIRARARTSAAPRGTASACGAGGTGRQMPGALSAHPPASNGASMWLRRPRIMRAAAAAAAHCATPSLRRVAPFLGASGPPNTPSACASLPQMRILKPFILGQRSNYPSRLIVPAGRPNAAVLDGAVGSDGGQIVVMTSGRRYDYPSRYILSAARTTVAFTGGSVGSDSTRILAFYPRMDFTAL